MCGIFGVIGNIEEELASVCLDKLSHRGPDARGLWSTLDVTLGHRRLSILDLSASANQPMSYGDGRYVITYNGEIYNFIEIRKKLEAKGCLFHTNSDTEVILAAFSIWGEACQEHFNGMWAFAIWDKQKKALFLSRDRFGKKPFFYTYLDHGGFSFASEMKAFFPLFNEVRANVSLVRDTSRIFQYESTEECVIEDVVRFPAGHCGWFRDGKLVLRQWWNTLDNLVSVPLCYEEQVEMFREIFLDSCRLRMRSDVPLGTALSGGLDSSATISTMAHIASHGQTQRMGKNWQHAFVASFPGTPLDETKYASMVTNHLGIDSTVIDINPLKSINDLNEFFYLFEDLYITSPIPFMQTYSAVKSNGVSVTLDGHGADELFGGYTFDFIVSLKDAGWNLKQAWMILSAYYEATPTGSSQFKTKPSKSLFLAIWHGKRWIKKMLPGYSEKYNNRYSTHRNWSRLDNLNRKLYAATHETILPTLLRNYDRYSMANGVEIRMPFMDHRIVSLAFSLPWTSKIRGGFSKSIIRDAVAPYMPNEITYRKTKIGFNSPIVDWMRGPLKEFMMDTVSSKSFKDCELIDAPMVAETILGIINNQNVNLSAGEAAWTMLSPYLWEQAVIKSVNH